MSGTNATLVVPTINRSIFLRRLLTYLAAEHFTGVVAIGDASDPVELEETKRVIESFQPSLNIRHVPCRGMNAPRTTVKVLESVDTGYATLLPDDDFLYPPAIDRCVAFLDEHAEYSVAAGRGCIFSVAGDCAYGEITDVVPYTIRSLEQETAAERLIDHFTHYSVITFGIHRTAELRAAFAAGASMGPMHFAGEILPGALHVISGKVRVFDELYLIRQNHSARYPPLPTMLAWMSDSAWSGALSEFVIQSTDALITSDGVPRKEAERLVARAFSGYLAHQIAVRDLSPAGSEQRQSTGMRSFLRRHAGLRRLARSARSHMPDDHGRLSLEALTRPSSRFHTAFDSVARIVDSPGPAILEGGALAAFAR